MISSPTLACMLVVLPIHIRLRKALFHFVLFPSAQRQINRATGYVCNIKTYIAVFLLPFYGFAVQLETFNDLFTFDPSALRVYAPTEYFAFQKKEATTKTATYTGSEAILFVFVFIIMLFYGAKTP